MVSGRKRVVVCVLFVGHEKSQRVGILEKSSCEEDDSKLSGYLPNCGPKDSAQPHW